MVFDFSEVLIYTEMEVRFLAIVQLNWFVKFKFSIDTIKVDSQMQTLLIRDVKLPLDIGFAVLFLIQRFFKLNMQLDLRFKHKFLP